MNDAYNEMLCELSNGISINDKWQYGKKIPYLGGFWRNINFDKPISIGISQAKFVGFMPDNKWYYPERFLTKEEKDKVMTVISAAYLLYKNGQKDQASTKLEELWILMEEFNTYNRDTLRIHSMCNGYPEHSTEWIRLI